MQRWTRRGRSLKSPWRRIRVACQKKISRSRNSKTRVMKKTSQRDHCVVEKPKKKNIGYALHVVLCVYLPPARICMCTHTHMYIYVCKRHVCAHTWTNMPVGHTYTYTYTWCRDTQTLYKCMHKQQWSSSVNSIYIYIYTYICLYIYIDLYIWCYQYAHVTGRK